MQRTNLRYLGHQEPEAGSLYGTIPSVGGQVLAFTAGAALNVGDVVQISGTNTVNKATTNPNKTIGVVIGGDALPDKGIFEPGLTASSTAIATLLGNGVAATTASGQTVLVLVQGVAYVKCDGAISNGAQIKASTTTAGKVTAATSALTIAAGAVAVTSSAANGAIISGDDAAGHVIGKLIDAAATADGDYRLAYINIH